MARYIDADALKERLEDFSKWCKDGRKQGVDFVLDCPLPNMPTADVAPRAEWISVEERLPESNDRCIVWSFDYIWRIRFASYNNGTKRWYVVCGGEIKDTQRDGVKVTHWLPIPEPPKGDHHE